MNLNPFLFIIKLSDCMPWFKKNADTQSSQEIYQTSGLALPQFILFETELENQKRKLSETDPPYAAVKRAYESFGLSEQINYEIRNGMIHVNVLAYSQKDALKLLGKQKEAVKKAFNVDLDILGELNLSKK